MSPSLHISDRFKYNKIVIVMKSSISYDDWKKKLDTFEYRWNSGLKLVQFVPPIVVINMMNYVVANSYYLFNPWTGETILTNSTSLSLPIMDRTKSMWAKPDKFPSINAKTVQLYPEYFASRRWGRRKFLGWGDDYNAAATHITTVLRGYIARQSYYYFVDTWYPERETSWYKPLLAFPGDIIPAAQAIEYDPDDYMAGEKYSRRNFTAGPFLKIAGLSKYKTQRAKQPAFFVENPWREQAISKYEEIDLVNATLGTIIAWMDGSKASQLLIDEYHLMRAAICDNNWGRVVNFMREHSDNNMIQLYGFHCFSKTEVPLDPTGLLSFGASDAMDIVVETIKDEKKEISDLIKVFALNAFHNILSTRAGRVEFVNTNSIREIGDERQKAIERYLNSRLSIFLSFFTKIETETVMVYKKGQKNAIPEERPLQRAIDMIEAALKCLCVISQEIDVKEQLALMMVKPVVIALEICEEESYATALGLQLFYNFCYRCEMGQEAVSYVCDVDFFANIHHNHSGDPDIMRQCRKLELALKPGGWRGNVEEQITKELYSIPDVMRVGSSDE